MIGVLVLVLESRIEVCKIEGRRMQGADRNASDALSSHKRDPYTSFFFFFAWASESPVPIDPNPASTLSVLTRASCVLLRFWACFSSVPKYHGTVGEVKESR
jgi:hypothetical protein